MPFRSLVAFDATHRRVMAMLILLAALVLIALMLALAPAHADSVQTVATSADSPVQTTTQVGIPIGDWLGGSAEVIIAIAGAFLAWAMRQLPASVVQILQTMQADQLLGKAVAYAVNAVAGAEKGKVLKVDVANEVIAQALQYVVDHAPAWLVKWMGGEVAIQQKIIARLDIETSSWVPAASTLVAATPAVADQSPAKTVAPASPGA